MIKQLSVFVENRPGSLMDIRAVSSFDAPEFGILRLIVDKPMEAKEYLTSKGFVVRVSEVLGAELEDKKGTLNNMLTILAEGKININYIYSFIIRDGLAPVMVFHTDDFDKAIESLKKANVKIVDENEL